MSHDHHDPHAIHQPPTFWLYKYVFSTDHKVIGVQFMFTSIFFIIFGGLLALGVRYQLAWPSQDVPFASLLATAPEGSGGPAMTQRAPEANVGLWSVGDEVEWKVDVTTTLPAAQLVGRGGHSVKQAPAGDAPAEQTVSVPVQATLTGFPDMLAITLPQYTLVQESDGAMRRLDADTPAFVDPAQVMGGYDYARQDIQARPGTTVIVPTMVNTESGEMIRDASRDRTYVLRGREILRPATGGAGAGVPESNTSSTLNLPVRSADTMVSFSFGKQDAKTSAVVQVIGGEFEISAGELADLTSSGAWKLGDNVTFPGEVKINGKAVKANLPGKITAIDGGSVQLGTNGNIAATSRGTAIRIAVDSQAATLSDVPIEIVPGSAYEPAAVPQTFAAASLNWPTKVPASGGNVTRWKQTMTTDAYLQLFTMHATIMIFFVLMPMLLGAFGNFLIPLMIGARDMAFPKLNMLSYWIAVPSGALMMLSFWTAGGPAGGGWTMYPTLSSGMYSPNTGTTLWVASVGLVGFSTIVGTLNYITTIINMRAPGMTMFRLPLTIWSLLVTSVLALLATPVLTAAAFALMADRTLGTVFFSPQSGGQPLMWQHLFWFFGHPEVYILILPPMGIASDIIATFARKPIFGYKPMVFAISAIGGLGFIVWGHHMFQSGMNPILGTTFMASTIMIAVPSAIKTFNWLGTMYSGNLRYTPAMLNAIGFVSMFVIGGLSGIFMAAAPVDIQIHDTYFIVAHIHYVFFGGTLFGVFAGVYYWYPKMFGRQMNYRWGVIHFILTIIAFNLTFFLMHVLGVNGHPRRYASIMEYPALQHIQPMNVLMTIGAMMLGMAQLPFLYNFWASLPPKLGRWTAGLFAACLTMPFVVGIYGWSESLAPMRDNASLTVLSIQDGVNSWFVQWVDGKVTIDATLFIGTMKFSAYLIFVSAVWTALFGGAVGLAWWLGQRIRIGVVLHKLLYIVVLPAYLAPLLLKQDVYLWIGMPGLFSYAWVLVVLTALPGLAYLAIARPQDQYGFNPGANPWEANTLEWSIPSPPPFHNFDVIPTVYRGPYEYSSPVVEEDYLPQPHLLPPGVVEPAGH
jgi:cytochrome c oxidase subunit 1